jgi:hypothetical protein
MIGGLIELIATIWPADSEMRDNSLLGESRLDKESRRFVAWLCGGAIVLLLLLPACLVLWFLRGFIFN